MKYNKQMRGYKKSQPYQRWVNGYRIYCWKKVPFEKRKVGPLLDTWDKMKEGEWMVADLPTARLIRASLVRRDYDVIQIKLKKDCYRMVKV